MSQYLDKEKLQEYVRYGIERGTVLSGEWQGRNDVEYWKVFGSTNVLKGIMKQLESGTFDNYAAHNAVALLDDLEIKLNEANREIERLREALDMIEIQNGSIDSFAEIDKILQQHKGREEEE